MTASQTHSLAGAKLTDPTAAAEFALGTRLVGDEGSEFVYVQADAGGVTGAGYVVLIDEAWSADMIDTTNSASGFQQLVGVALAAFTASYYGWVQVKGVANIRVAANAAANAKLNSTATAGQIDDDQTAGSEDIDGIALTTANGGSAATAEGVLNHPTVGATN